MSGETEKHRVAVVVFCEVEAVDELDASTIAAAGVRQAMTGSPMGAVRGLLLPVKKGNGEEYGPVVVHNVMDVGMAAGNGYLWLTPTSKAY